MTEPIPEIISKKRGRPELYSDKLLNTYRMSFSQVTTKRGLQNIVWQQHALGVLGLTGEFAWIAPSHDDVMYNIAPMKLTILQHLGRLSSDEEIKQAARHICDHQLNTAAAIEFIRRFRSIPKKPGDVLSLFSVLAKAMDSYCETHDITHRQALLALDNLRDCIEDSQHQEPNP